MSVALTVIMLEITDKADMLLPIMLVIGVAKAVGDIFTPPLYDMILEVTFSPPLFRPQSLVLILTLA